MEKLYCVAYVIVDPQITCVKAKGKFEAMIKGYKKVFGRDLKEALEKMGYNGEWDYFKITDFLFEEIGISVFIDECNPD